MVKKKISLNSIDKVKRFVKIAERYECDIDLASERYIVDGRSIMGIFSLNLSRPIDMTIHADEELASNILENMSEFFA